MIIDFIVLDFPGIKLFKEKKGERKKGVLIVAESDKENSNYVSSTTLVTRLSHSLFFPFFRSFVSRAADVLRRHTSRHDTQPTRRL